ncbi:MAG: diguanylate cyclase [Spirochaetes bacterium]|nr:diguanylate cyclase [Spirochaetota bacterium]
MGLLEKAFKYKKEINSKGKTTLIDTIEGPAETEMLYEDDDIPEADESGDINFVLSDDSHDNEDLFQLPDDDDDFSPLDALSQQKVKIIKDEDITENELRKQKSNKNEIQLTPDTKLTPLTPDDDPIIPADVESLNINIDENIPEDDYSLQDENIDIPEIEPEIIDEENTADDNEQTDVKDEDPDAYPFSDTEIYSGTNNFSTSQDIAAGIGEKYQTQFEIKKEISKSESKKTLFEVVIFSVMGQIVTSSVSILIKNADNNWIIADSNKSKTEYESIVFDSGSGIMKNLRKNIIDIENYKDDPDCLVQYNDLKLINTRLLFPWTYKSSVSGILTLGHKITDEDYTEEEKEIIQSICEAAAIEFKKLDKIEKLKKDIEKAQSDLSFSLKLDSISEKIYSSADLREIKKILKPDFDEIGITGYSFFIRNFIKKNYISVINSEDSTPAEDENVHSIAESCPFITLIKSQKTVLHIEDYNVSEIVKSAFSEEQIKKMSCLWVVPFKTGNILAGFLTIFKVKDILLNEELRPETDNKLCNLSAGLIPAIINIMNADIEKNRHIDHVEGLFYRINKELKKSRELNIPITMVVISIKNFKRYENIFGFEKSRELINHFSGLIVSRLSETDFSARYDRNKFLLLLPGKDKKFASALANTIRNEFMQKFRKNEMQILITFLLSESPLDGDDLQSFTNNMD